MIRCSCLLLVMLFVIIFFNWDIPKENTWIDGCMMDMCLCTNTSTKECLWVYDGCKKSWMVNNIVRTSIQVISFLSISCVLFIVLVYWDESRRPERVMEMTEENPAE